MKYKVLLLTTITFLSTCFGAGAKNILSLKESITDNAIVYPSSFETNTKEMMENWYLKNYAVIDESMIESRDYGLVSDAEYIKRLNELSAGTDIELPFNQIVRSYIERYVVKSRTLVAQMLGMCPYYMPIFEEALERHKMPLELRYIPIIESALNPTAVSPAGACGLWQFMITTAKGVGLTVDSQLDERRDPYKSSEKAAVYFKQLYDTYHDWSLAIAAYNCGPGNVNKAIRRAGTDNPDFWEIYNYLPRETRGYVPAFIAANYVMNYYQKHNINPTLTKKPLVIDTVVVNKRIYLDQISQVLNIPLDEIRILNPQYRGNMIPGDVRHCTLALPSQQIYSYIMAEDKIENYHKAQFDRRKEVEPGDVRTIVDEVDSPGNTIYHEVTEGEDFIEIADRYGMQYDELMALNNLTTTTLHKGQVLEVINRNSVIEETVMQPNKGRNGSTASRDDLMASRDKVNDNNTNYTNYNENSNNRNSSNSYNKNNNVNDNNKKTNTNRNEVSKKPVPEKKVTKEEPKQAVPEKKKDDNKKAADKKAADKKAADKKAADKKAKTPKTSKHKVAQGDNLTKIANNFGVSPDDIRAANNINGDHIEIGQDLVIPEKGYAKKHPQAKQQTQQQTKQHSKHQPKQQAKQQTKQHSKHQPKQQTKQQPKQQPKQQAKQQTKQQPKQQAKQPKQQEKQQTKSTKKTKKK